MVKTKTLLKSYNFQKSTTKTELKVLVRLDRLPPSSFEYVINLSNKLYDNNSSFTYAAIATLDVSIASKRPIATWQSTQCEFMKLITRTNVSCPNLDIHKSKVVVVVIQNYKVRSQFFLWFW
jgi:hypothetical protein